MSVCPPRYHLTSLERDYNFTAGPFRGNYGEVTIWENKQISGMKIAVKTPYPYLNPDVVIAEAKKQYKLRNSTRIVRIQSFGKEGKLRYIVMEYCPSSLENMLKGVFLKSTEIPYQEAAKIIGRVTTNTPAFHRSISAKKLQD